MKYKIFAVILCAVLSAIPLSEVEAQATTAALKMFPDFLSVRSEFLSAVITAPTSRALSFVPSYRDSPAGRIRVSVEREGAFFYVLFQRERGGGYPVGSRGNVIIKRDVATGYVTRVLWFLSDDGRSYISLTPKNERTIVDYVVAGSVVRGGYSISRLIYYFFTNSFSYLYDATRAGLDWSLAIGEPGPSVASALAAELVSGRPSGAAEALVRAAADFTKFGVYLESVGRAGSLPEEVNPNQYTKAVSFANPLDPVSVDVPAWTEAHGLAIESAAVSILAGIATESAYIALISGNGALSRVSLAVIPYRDALGSSVFAAVDADTHETIDFTSLVSTMPGATVRLFRVPLPASR